MWKALTDALGTLPWFSSSSLLTGAIQITGVPSFKLRFSTTRFIYDSNWNMHSNI